MRYICAIIYTILICNAVSYKISQKLGFAAPFSKFDYSGQREVENWYCGGDAVINEYFIRLTLDRQSKTGYCWSENTLENGEFVTTIKFRISGQGENLFGDGFSVFFTQEPRHENGKMLGTNDIFYGFAIVFSTFRNTEFARYHRDISLYVGDGVNGAYTQDQEHPGCYSQYRFHEKRQDFSVDNYAVVKIGYSASTGTVKVAIDETNSGEFHTCLNEKINLKANWWKQAYIGLSSSTGQLADNHDILSVETTLGVSDPDLVKTDINEEKVVTKADNEMFSKLINEYHIDQSRLTAGEKALLRVMEKLEVQQQMDTTKLKKEIEHTLVSVNESLNNMIKKLKERGDTSDDRIAELEASLKNKITSSLSEDMERRLKTLEHVFDESVEKEVKKNSGSWILPFLLLVVVVGVVLMISFNKYRYLKKAHIL